MSPIANNLYLAIFCFVLYENRLTQSAQKLIHFVLYWRYIEWINSSIRITTVSVFTYPHHQLITNFHQNLLSQVRSTELYSAIKTFLINTIRVIVVVCLQKPQIRPEQWALFYLCFGYNSSNWKENLQIRIAIKMA